MTDTITPDSEPDQPLGLGCNEQLGPIGYMHADAVRALRSSSGSEIVVARAGAGYDVPVYTEAQLLARVAAERDRWKEMLLAATREAYAHGRDGKDVSIECDDSGWRVEWKA